MSEHEYHEYGYYLSPAGVPSWVPARVTRSYLAGSGRAAASRLVRAAWPPGVRACAFGPEGSLCRCAEGPRGSVSRFWTRRKSHRPSWVSGSALMNPRPPGAPTRGRFPASAETPARSCFRAGSRAIDRHAGRRASRGRACCAAPANAGLRIRSATPRPCGGESLARSGGVSTRCPSGLGMRSRLRAPGGLG